MNETLFHAMYGMILRKGAAGEGSRGGKIIGHTPAGKPIYDSEGHSKGAPAGRKPYPGEEAHKIEEPPSRAQTKKTFMPPDGTTHGRYDSPNLKAYKTLQTAFKKQGVDFMGHISYDPKTDQIVPLSPQGPALMRQVYDTFMAQHAAKHPPKPAGK